MDTNPTNLMENFCRTCMGEEESETFTSPRRNITKALFSIFSESQQTATGNNITIMELLKHTTPQLSIECDDLLPKNICQSCLDKVLNIHEFQQNCLAVEQRLNDLVKNVADASGVLDDPLVNETNLQVVTDSSSRDYNGLDKASDNSAYQDEEKGTGFRGDDLDERNMWNSLDEMPLSEILKNKMTENLEVVDLEVDADSLQVHQRPEFNAKTIKERTQSESEREDCDHQEVETENADDPNFTLETQYNIASRNNTESPVKIKGARKNVHQFYSTDIQAKQKQDDPQEKLFICDECGSRVKTRKSLKRHKRIHLRQPGEKAPPKTNKNNTKYECKYCPKVFVQSSSLKDHLRTHTGEKPYLCSECGKAFKILSNMKQHLLRHGDDRPYECPDCPKKFPCLTDLASHKAVHNKSKSHVCDICGAGFGKPYLLKKHKMYHTGEKNHKCDYCEMRFVVAEHCRRHMRIHTGEKPYICKYCERAFAQSNDLSKHLRCHLGNKVYRCTLCPQGFRLQSDLRSHFNTHKNDDEETRLRNLQALKDDELRIQRKFGLVQTTDEQ